MSEMSTRAVLRKIKANLSMLLLLKKDNKLFVQLKLQRNLEKFMKWMFRHPRSKMAATKSIFRFLNSRLSTSFSALRIGLPSGNSKATKPYRCLQINLLTANGMYTIINILM